MVKSTAIAEKNIRIKWLKLNILVTFISINDIEIYVDRRWFVSKQKTINEDTWIDSPNYAKSFTIPDSKISVW